MNKYMHMETYKILYIYIYIYISYMYEQIYACGNLQNCCWPGKCYDQVCSVYIYR